jgi:hypothetical protein
MRIKEQDSLENNNISDVRSPPRSKFTGSNFRSGFLVCCLPVATAEVCDRAAVIVVGELVGALARLEFS